MNCGLRAVLNSFAFPAVLHTQKCVPNRFMTNRPKPFTPAHLRSRHDGWTPEKQTGFIEALAECGCVTEACERVGMSPRSAYALRARIDAQSFRIAWDTALDYAVRR